MSLSFPNQSRSYEEAGKRIRFIGHDGMFEIPFVAGRKRVASTPSMPPSCYLHGRTPRLLRRP